MSLAIQVRAVMDNYPRIYFACHRRHVRDERTGAAVSAHRVSVLGHLDLDTPTHVSALARHMGVTASTMSLTLDRLEADGYVVRQPDTADQRRVCVRLTGAGDALRKASSVLDPQLVERLLEAMSPVDRAIAVEGLALMAAAASRIGERTWNPENASFSDTAKDSRTSAAGARGSGGGGSDGGGDKAGAEMPPGKRGPL